MSQPLVTYLPFKAGLPPMGSYLRSLIKRRAFISEFARSELRNQNYGSVFGQLWLVINPLLLSGVYFLLIFVIGGSSDSTRFAHLTSSLFLFYLVANSLTGGVKAITSGQRLILNTSFPRIMLPLAAVVISFLKFLPTFIVALVIHAVVGLPFSWQMLWAIPVLVIAIFLATGLAILFSCINVYFRDISSILPYMTRSLLYLSPVLYEASKVSEEIRKFEIANPLFYLLDAWSHVMVHAEAPSMNSLLHAIAYAAIIFIFGSYFFLSRERDFAVRL
jgi:teichoic acid transport system permease protein